jgi:hypothetical protein
VILNPDGYTMFIGRCASATLGAAHEASSGDASAPSAGAAHEGQGRAAPSRGWTLDGTSVPVANAGSSAADLQQQRQQQGGGAADAAAAAAAAGVGPRPHPAPAMRPRAVSHGGQASGGAFGVDASSGAGRTDGGGISPTTPSPLTSPAPVATTTRPWGLSGRGANTNSNRVLPVAVSGAGQQGARWQ